MRTEKMFGKSQNTKKLEYELHHTKKALEGLQQLNEQLIKSFKQTTTLMDIDVRDRKNIFTFQRDGDIFLIETYHAIEDNVSLWKQQAGIET